MKTYFALARCFPIIFLLLACFGPHAAAQANLGQVKVGASATGSVTVTVNTAGVLGSISVRMMGAENLDFSNAGGGSCATGTAYAVNTTCTVSVGFNPRLAGQRHGAVVLLDTSGNLIGTEYVLGTGLGPQATIFTGAGVETGIALPSYISPLAVGIAADGLGDVWYSDSYEGDFDLCTASSESYTCKSMGGAADGGLSVDGAGDVYFPGGSSPGQLVLQAPGKYVGGGENCFILGLLFPSATAVDGTGAVYLVSDGGPQESQINKVVYNGPNCTLPASFVGARGDADSDITVDDQGNIFMTVGTLIEYPVGAGGQYTSSNAVATVLQDPFSPVLDGNGNIFIANFGNDTGPNAVFLEALQSDGTYKLLGGMNNDGPLALDGNGNLFTDGGAYEFNLLNPSPVSLGKVGVGQSDSNWVMTVANTGNAALTINSVTYPTDFPEAKGIPGECAAGQTVAVGGFCTITVVFSPVAALSGASSQSLSEEIKLVSNSLNGSATEQDIPVTGTETLPMPTIALSSSENQAPSGTAVTFTAKVTGVSGSPVPTGTVTFLDGTTTLGTATLSGGTAGYTAASLADGSHSISAQYSGDTVYAPLTSAALTQVMGLSTPVITWPTPAPIAYGTALSATQLDATASFAGASVAGTFAYSPAAGAILSAGPQTLNTTFTPTNTSLYRPATASVTLTVTQAAPTITLTSSKNPCLTTDTITYTATVASSSGTPTGTITWTDSTVSDSLTGPLVSGSYTVTETKLTPGTHSITATYSGDSNFPSVTSAVLTETVESFSIAVSSNQSSSATISPGGTANYMFTVTPPSVGTPLAFSVSGSPSGATASFSPTGVAIGAGPTSVQLAVTVPSTAALRLNGDPFGRSVLPVAFGVLFLPFALRRRFGSKSRLSILLLCLATAALALGLGACGGGGGGGGGGGSTPTNYTLTVTAASGTLTQSAQVTLTVN